MRFDPVTLHPVLAIAETRSSTRAAAQARLALVAAGKRLSDLETRWGVAVPERARVVGWTEAGRVVVRHIRALNASLHALEREVVEFSRGIKDDLRIAANASAIAECLPAELANFSPARPGIRISLADLTRAEVPAAVASGRAGVGIFAPLRHDSRRSCRPCRPCRPCRSGEAVGRLAMLVPARQPLLQHGLFQHLSTTPPGIPFDALPELDIVGLHLGAALQKQMRERARALGRARNVRVPVLGFDAIARRVEAGLGVALLPAGVAQRFARIVLVSRLALDEPWAQRHCLLDLQDLRSLAVLQRFADALCPPAPQVDLPEPTGPTGPGPTEPAPIAPKPRAARQSPARQRTAP